MKPILTKSSSASVYVDIPDDVPPPRSSSSKKLSFSFGASSPVGKSFSLLDFLSPRFSQYGDLASLAASLHRGPKADLEACLAALSPTSRTRPARPVQALQPRLDMLRAYKSPAEVALLRKAADISARGHQRAMRLANKHSGLTEHSLVAAFEGACASEGSVRPAYVPVCAAGSAALMVHYTANNQRLQEGAFVLLDAGCEYGGYPADITRTFPVAPNKGAQTGKFTSAQKDLYSAVLAAQKELVKRCTESSAETLASLHRRSCELLKTELRQLGFDLLGAGLERLYAHYVGHPLGVDLHDTVSFDRTSRWVSLVQPVLPLNDATVPTGYVPVWSSPSNPASTSPTRPRIRSTFAGWASGSKMRCSCGKTMWSCSRCRLRKRS